MSLIDVLFVYNLCTNYLLNSYRNQSVTPLKMYILVSAAIFCIFAVFISGIVAH